MEHQSVTLDPRHSHYIKKCAFQQKFSEKRDKEKVNKAVIAFRKRRTDIRTQNRKIHFADGQDKRRQRVFC
ncbi:hypothetical protein L596_000402 [Steinernema carpocapsae]|uniref:Uncharacterized protein n=1 Tax=Steinernema carpocapsae TaxID=34508 RepID=A0A4U8UI25_STECR|nr:hypothetical protein L596_000402 [Steinernema carpocapsae]